MNYRTRLEYDALHHREVFADKTGLYIRWYGRVMRRQVKDELYKKGDVVYVEAKAGPQDKVKLRSDQHEEWHWEGETGPVNHYIPREEPKLPDAPPTPTFEVCEKCGLRMSSGLLKEHVCDPEMGVMEEAKKLAGEHWAWFGPMMEKVYKDAFVHGYKHGREANGHTV